MKRRLLAVILLIIALPTFAQAPTSFDTVADTALATMRARATELNIQGVAIVAYSEGDTTQAWSSKMIVVGKYKTDVTPTDKGTNLLAAVYAKAAEMADTHKDSGSKSRDMMTAEVGWKGGLITRAKNGYLIAAFSGGKDEDDLQVSHAGLLKLQAGF